MVSGSYKSYGARVLLVDPSFIGGGGQHLLPNLGLAYIAAALREKCPSVEVAVDGFYVNTIPSTIRSLDAFYTLERQFCNRIAHRAQDFDFLGVTCTYMSYPRALRLFQACNCKRKKELRTILGGPHPTLLDQVALWRNKPFEDCDNLDFVVRGEGEQTMCDLTQHADTPERVQGITFRKDGRIVRTQSRPQLTTLDELSLPAWDLFELGHYSHILPLLTSRGCVYTCAFCDERLLFRKYRFRSVPSIVDEIRSNVQDLKVSRFFFNDSNLTSYPYLEDLCHSIVEANLAIQWRAFARVDEINETLVQKMKLAGCRVLMLGIESGSQELLNRMRKQISVRDIRRAVELLKRYGIKVNGSFMIGFPGETEQTAQETIRFAKGLDLDACSWHVFIPSISMIVKPHRWKIVFPPDFEWKNLDIDLPSHLLEDYLHQHAEGWWERHTVPYLTLTAKPELPTVAWQLHDTMSFNMAARLVTQAIKQTSPSLDFDTRLLEVSNSTPDQNSRY
ncbi:MAG: B12-binding domain-containing radical SAM protein [Promethearchaeota archaeon]